MLCNNAGVGPPGGLVWESTPNDWAWTFGVNVFGVAHGILAFVPRMLASGEEGVVVNTSSPDGPIAPLPQAAVYASTKCAVTCLTECLAAQLAAESTTVRGGRVLPVGQGPARHRAVDLGSQPSADLSPGTAPVDAGLTVADLQGQGRAGPAPRRAGRPGGRGIQDGRFVMVLDVDRHAGTLRERAERFAAGENPTEPHELAPVSATTGTYDPYDPVIDLDPQPTWQRLRGTRRRCTTTSTTASTRSAATTTCSPG